jgi:hypothetical protein
MEKYHHVFAAAVDGVERPCQVQHTLLLTDPQQQLQKAAPDVRHDATPLNQCPCCPIMQHQLPQNGAEQAHGHQCNNEQAAKGQPGFKHGQEVRHTMQRSQISRQLFSVTTAACSCASGVLHILGMLRVLGSLCLLP